MLPAVAQAPIGNAATVDLAIAVCEAGGLGSLGASWTPPHALRAQVRALQRRTERPFCVNLVLAFEQSERVEVCREERVPVVSLSWGVRETYVRALRAGGAIVLAQVGSLDEATAAQAAGCDELIVQGIEAGGHVQGRERLLPLLRRVAAASSLPLWAAGGIAEERGVRAAREAGAAGVLLGTRFVASDEADAHPVWQQAICAAASEDAVYTGTFDIGWPDAPHRVLRNSTLRALDGSITRRRPGEGEVIAETDGRPLVRYADEIPRRRTTGAVEALALYAGESCGLIDRVEPAAAITERLLAAWTAGP